MESFKYKAQAFLMLLLRVIKHYNVIQIDDTIGKVQFPQGALHKALEGRRALQSPKGI